VRFVCFVVFRSQDLDYLELRFWIGMWLSLLLLLMVAFDLSALVRFITRFTEESFAMLIAIIFIFEALNKQYKTMKQKPVNFHPDDPLDYTCICNMSTTDLTDEESMCWPTAVNLSRYFTWIFQSINQSSGICIAPPTNSGRRRLTKQTIFGSGLFVLFVLLLVWDGLFKNA